MSRVDKLPLHHWVVDKDRPSTASQEDRTSRAEYQTVVFIQTWPYDCLFTVMHHAMK